MAKSTKGIQIDGAVVTKGDATQMRKLRCPGCQSMAVSQQDEHGHPICICTTCGRRFRSVKM